MKFTILSVLAVLAPRVLADANGRTFAVLRFHDDVLTYGRADPIISPGAQAGHVHMVQGGSNFATDMNDTTLLQSKCTSGLIQNDKSNYWVPSLYFQHSNGSFESVPMFYMNVYYFFEKTTDKITAFPPGLRMFSGDATKRTPPSTGAGNILDLAQGTPQPVQWTCPRSSYSPASYPANSDGLHGVGIGDPNVQSAGAGFPDANCDGYASPLRADVHFPSCYNPAVGLRDYKNNMVYPTNGNCPSGYIHVPHLFYEVYWNTLLFQDQWTPGQAKIPWVLSNGDNTGYSLHGDFISGWDTTTLQTIIDGCNAGDSGMNTCPNIIGGLASGNCAIPVPLPAGVTTREQVLGTLDKLPGNNPVTGWGVSGSSSSGSSVAAASSSSKSTSTSTTSTSTTTYKNAQQSSSTSSSATTTAKSTQTTTLTTTTTSKAASAASSVAAQSINGYNSYGCWSDNVNRVLTSVEYAPLGNNGVSNTACIAYCKAAGYSLAATEYGSQCFCGNTLSSDSKQLAASSCNMPCQAASGETCGGSWALSVWKKSGVSKRERHLHRHAQFHESS